VLPWEAVDKNYAFDGADGPVTLADLFGGRSQLVVYHFMFPSEWDEGCPHCFVSRAPIEKLVSYRRRMGWGFTWVSSGGSEFNYDYAVSFRPEELGEPLFNYGTLPPGFSDREGVSVFAHDSSGSIFHTYSAYGRGIVMLNAAYHYLDLVPRGRQEEERSNQWWVRRHDEYRP
jgi:predicted dithiol-disulfide oxidoreductase (DUF899 family)